MVQHIFNKTLTALILTFAYTLLLAHNFVPHQHEADAVPPAHHATNHHHDHGHGHDHSETGPENSDKPVSEPGPFLSDHHHSFADNKIHHLATEAGVKLLKKQAFQALVCGLSINYFLSLLPDKVPDPPAYQFPPTKFHSRSHALRGPPVA